jgi:hypothetical protein
MRITPSREGQAVLAQERIERAPDPLRRSHRLHQAQRPGAGVARARLGEPCAIGKCAQVVVLREILRIDRLGDSFRAFQRGKMVMREILLNWPACVPIAVP